MADNNNNYSNFNGYQPPQGQPQPVQPIYIQPDYNAHQAQLDAKKANSYGIWSIVCSTLLCCCCGVGPIIGLILSLVGLKKQKGNAVCIVGLVISALLIVYNVISFATYDWGSFANQFQEMLNDPEGYLEEYMQAYGAFINF